MDNFAPSDRRFCCFVFFTASLELLGKFTTAKSLNPKVPSTTGTDFTPVKAILQANPARFLRLWRRLFPQNSPFEKVR